MVGWWARMKARLKARWWMWRYMPKIDPKDPDTWNQPRRPFER